MEGESAPIVKSCIVSEGATWAQEGDNVTVTALDGSKDSYTLDIQSVSPVAYTSQEIVFDGTESYVKSAYGWDSTKKWRFSKTDSDYSREIAGKTHVELFLPACDTIIVKAGVERDVKVYINGEQLGSKVKLLKAGNTFVVAQSAPFMMSIISAQSSGDGGVAAIRMARKGGATDLGDVQRDHVPCTKVLRNGQIIIVRGEKIFTVTGQLVR